MSILIAGIGNIFLGDDAFGVEVLRQLATEPPLPDTRLVDFGIRGLDLAYELLKPWDAVFLVDAVVRGGPPGSLYLLDPVLPSASAAASQIDGHSMDPVKVLQLAVSLGASFSYIRIVACEPAPMPSCDDPYQEMAAGLSEPVRRAIPMAVQQIKLLIEEIHNPQIAIT